MNSFSLKPSNKKPNVAIAPKLGIFQQADDEDTKPQSKSLAFQNAKAGGVGMRLNITQSSRDKIAEEASKHLLEDPDVFEYDKYVDKYQSRREEIVEQKKEKGKARYITQISSAVDKRKREQTIIQERMAEKEIEKDNAQFGDKERFVTSSYLRMMQENKKFEEEEKKKEDYNQAHSINNEDNLGGFYKNLYANDIFSGGHRPDLSKEAKKPEAQKPTQVVPSKETRTTGLEEQHEKREAQRSRPEQDAGSTKMVEEKDHETVKVPIDISKNATELKPVRERSRSKSKERKQEAPAAEKTQETAEDRFEKAKSAKERYLQRKQQEQAKPSIEETPKN